MYRAGPVHYEHSDRVRGLVCGGVGLMHRLAQHTGLVEAIDRHVQVLKVALPYHESDHVLGIAYNLLSGGTCLQDIEQRRQDEVYLDGSTRAPLRRCRRRSTRRGCTCGVRNPRRFSTRR